MALLFWPYVRISFGLLGSFGHHQNSDGAGVDIFDHDFWVKAMPESQRSWIVIPTGRTSWVGVLL